MKKINLFDLVIFLFVVLFVYAATSKVLEFDLFKAQIGKSPLIMHYVDLIAWMIPILEIVISVFLIVPRLQLIGLFASFSLMFMFSAYIAFILTFSPYVPCSCGGILNAMGWTEHLIFNIFFTLLAVVGIILYNRQKKQESVESSFTHAKQQYQ
jgi:uncharacterized membrane protein YphA (DoxX/SURF4 family)